ncbi:selenide, water dikinase SelD [Candidatus Margulisiibacteriota bacterium]
MDLLQLIESGGCSAKLPANELEKALSGLPKNTDKRLLVDIDTHDDAGVYQLTDEIALIQTTDFFPPVCSDPYDFGQVAAANALSDVYAMGGTPINALNIVMFPKKNLSLDILKEILAGGMDKVKESGAVITGGHTITDDVPKYGLAVTGTVHPDRIITNSNAKPGDVLILTKPLGTGVIIAAKKVGEANDALYQKAVTTMKTLNKKAAEIMQEFNVKSATDITGFGLLGHTLKLAEASKVSIRIDSGKVPVIDGVYDLVEAGCVSCVMRRNLEFVEGKAEFSGDLDNNLKMIMLDAITSGGILMAVDESLADKVLQKLHSSGMQDASIIGSVGKGLPRIAV